MTYFRKSNKYLFRKERVKVFYFFQAEKKVAKKPLGHLRLCPRPRNALKVENSCCSEGVGGQPKKQPYTCALVRGELSRSD